MGNRNGLILCILMTAVFLLSQATFAAAERTTVGQNIKFSTTRPLKKGDTITWDWNVEGGGMLDFWIEDSAGTQYMQTYNATSDRGSFDVPENGDWSVNFYNHGSSPIILDYDLRMNSTPVNMIATLLFLIILVFAVVIIMVILLAKRRR